MGHNFSLFQLSLTCAAVGAVLTAVSIGKIIKNENPPEGENKKSNAGAIIILITGLIFFLGAFITYIKAKKMDRSVGPKPIIYDNNYTFYTSPRLKTQISHMYNDLPTKRVYNNNLNTI